jgi:hypothetical protein
MEERHLKQVEELKEVYEAITKEFRVGVESAVRLASAVLISSALKEVAASLKEKGSAIG